MLAVVSVAGVLLAPWMVQVLAPGFAAVPGKLALTATLLRIMFPYIFLVGLAALFMAILNSLGHFLAPALSPTVLNLVMIASALLVAPVVSQPVIPIAIAVVVGGIGQLAIQVPAAVACGWRPAMRVAPRDPAVREIGRLMLPGRGRARRHPDQRLRGNAPGLLVGGGERGRHDLRVPAGAVPHRGGRGGDRHRRAAGHGARRSPGTRWVR